MKKQTRICYLFVVLFLLQVILTIKIWWSQGLVLPLIRYLLGYNLNQFPSEPLFVLRRYGLGTSLNPRNPLGYKISLLMVMGVLIFLFCLNLFSLISH